MNKIEARVSLTNSGFVAELSDEQRIERSDIRGLAAALHAAGVTAETAHCGDWRNGEHVLGAGQQIALKAELRAATGVGSAMIKLADYPALERLAARRTDALRLDVRACKFIYREGLASIDPVLIQTHELEFIASLGFQLDDGTRARTVVPSLRKL